MAASGVTHHAVTSARDYLAEDLVVKLCQEKDGQQSVSALFRSLGSDQKRSFKTETEFAQFLTLYNDVFAFKKQGSKLFVKVQTRLDICKDYTTRYGCRDAQTCGGLHICKFFMIQGTCEFKEKCKFGHNINTFHNMDLLKKHRISTLPLQYLRQVFSWSRENLTNTNPTPCRFYNVGGNACTNGPTCSHLHICRHFLKNTCKFNYGCKRSHNLLDQHNKQILENYGINTRRRPKDVLTDVQSMLQDDDEDMVSTASGYSQRQVFSLSGENYINTNPTPCRFYNVGGDACKNGRTCSHLHICRHFLKNTCKFNYRCKRSHNLLDQHNKQILENYGINTRQTPKDVLIAVQSMLQDDDEDMSSTASGYSQASSHGFATFRPNGNQAGFGQSPAHRFTRPSPQPGFNPLLRATSPRHSPPNTNLGMIRTLSVSSVAVADEETEICMFYLRGQCGFGNSCRMHHKDGPYQWQYMEEATGAWEDIADNESVEINYCHVSCTVCSASTRSGHKRIPCRLEFHDDNSMTLRPQGKKSPLKVRRLSTASSVQKPASFIYVTKWIWYWLDENNKWKKYGAENCRKVKSNANVEDIENAFLTSNGSIRFDTTEGEKYDLDLARMVQRNVNYKTERKVRRRPEYIDWKDEAKLKRRTKGIGADAIKSVPSKTAGQSPSGDGTKKKQKSSSGQSLMFTSIPDHWDIYRADDVSGAQQIRLDEKDNRQEYKKVATKFLASMSGSEIRKIYRVQCMEVFDAYDRKKKWMTKQNKKAPKELELFHGTKKDNIQAICRQGFDCRISGSRTGTLYGKGTYFAADANLAMGYADSKFVYLCKVLVGDSCQGMSHYVRPPPKDPKKPNENFYDSCVDKGADPKMYIIFKSEQAYPEYIIKYT